MPMKKNDLYRITAYHCAHCGAPTKPNKLLCDYCGQKALLKQYVQNSMIDSNRWRVLVNTGENYINFNQIVAVNGISLTTEEIKASSFEDGITRRVSSSMLDMDIAYTNRGEELCEKLKRDIEYNCRIESLDNDMVLEFKALFFCKSMPYIEPLTFAKSTLTFDVTDYQGIKKIFLPGEMTCPNCGAPVQSRLGACNYCGGWLEYEF